jgi:hypothetical protein
MEQSRSHETVDIIEEQSTDYIQHLQQVAMRSSTRFRQATQEAVNRIKGTIVPEED